MNHACKKSLIFTSAIICVLVIIALICAFLKLNACLILLSLIILPVIFITDLCFFLFPCSIVLVFLLSLYTVISKNYSRFNLLYMILFVIIILGITNMNIDGLYSNKSYFYHGLDIRSCWYAFCGIILTTGIVCAFKRKDTRIYVYSYTLGLLLYITYQIANILD